MGNPTRSFKCSAGTAATAGTDPGSPVLDRGWELHEVDEQMLAVGQEAVVRRALRAQIPPVTISARNPSSDHTAMLTPSTFIT